MGRKHCLPSLFFRARDTPRSSPSLWAWPSCRHPKTHSYRAADDIYKTVNSIYFDSPESFFTFSVDDQKEEAFSAASVSGTDSATEHCIRKRRSDRLFFEPGDASSSSIMEEAKASAVSFRKSIVMAMDSEDPCRDFRVSMEEMVAAHGLKGWESLLQLLLWYLRANGRKTHGFIFSAFVDLLVGLAASSSSSSSPSLSSSFSTSLEIEELRGKGRSC